MMTEMTKLAVGSMTDPDEYHRRSSSSLRPDLAAERRLMNDPFRSDEILSIRRFSLISIFGGE